MYVTLVMGVLIPFIAVNCTINHVIHQGLVRTRHGLFFGLQTRSGFLQANPDENRDKTTKHGQLYVIHVLTAKGG